MFTGAKAGRRERSPTLGLLVATASRALCPPGPVPPGSWPGPSTFQLPAGPRTLLRAGNEWVQCPDAQGTRQGPRKQQKRRWRGGEQEGGGPQGRRGAEKGGLRGGRAQGRREPLVDLLVTGINCWGPTAAGNPLSAGEMPQSKPIRAGPWEQRLHVHTSRGAEPLGDSRTSHPDTEVVKPEYLMRF